MTVEEWRNLPGCDLLTKASWKLAPQYMNRILVIRGGAIGDFILLLPALHALRTANPKAHIEILGYKHIAELADNRFYADRVRSIEYGPLSRFFARGAEVSPELREYFASFDLVVSYLYDPDQIFEHNLRKCRVSRLLCGPAKLSGTTHASRQLARPIEELGLTIENWAARFYPSPADRQFGDEFLSNRAQPIVTIHPGSGSDLKNWPLQNWIELGESLLSDKDFTGTIVVVGGEADGPQLENLHTIWRNEPRVHFAENLRLVHLGAILQNTTFLGHDSGISHLAAAAGAKCYLLFGSSNPAVWAPLGENVSTIQAPDGDLKKLDVATVRKGLNLGRTR